MLLSRRETKVAELDQLLVDRDGLLGQVRQVDGLIAATRAYIRELDIRSGGAPGDRRLRGTASIRDMALSVLRGADGPLQVSAIRRGIEERFGERIERTSLAPILSKMGQRGELRRDEDVGWSIP